MGVGTDVERLREPPASTTIAGIREMLGRETGSEESYGADGVDRVEAKGVVKSCPGLPSACLCLGNYLDIKGYKLLQPLCGHAQHVRYRVPCI